MNEEVLRRLKKLKMVKMMKPAKLVKSVSGYMRLLTRRNRLEGRRVVINLVMSRVALTTHVPTDEEEKNKERTSTLPNGFPCGLETTSSHILQESFFLIRFN